MYVSSLRVGFAPSRAGSSDRLTSQSEYWGKCKEEIGERERFGRSDTKLLEANHYRDAMPMDVFTAPWPGPGNSEGPADPDGWSVAPLPLPGEPDQPDRVEPPFVVPSPWPGPGDSDGSVAV
jgi:hypothetical protein